MKSGTKVKWTTSKGVQGSGVILREETLAGEVVAHYLVIVDAEPGEEHRVIYCAHTWLTEVA